MSPLSRTPQKCRWLLAGDADGKTVERTVRDTVHERDNACPGDPRQRAADIDAADAEVRKFAETET